MAKKSEEKTLFRRIGDLLFKEGLEYGHLNPIVVGTHTSYLVHDDVEEVGGHWISIHFRENLGQLSKIGSWRKRGMIFLRAIEIDLHLLSKELKEGSLRDIGMIIGLTGLSASWGERHGFTTWPYPIGEDLIRIHNDSIVGNPNNEKGQINPLNLFFFAPQGFINEFYKEDLSRA